MELVLAQVQDLKVVLQLFQLLVLQVVVEAVEKPLLLNQEETVVLEEVEVQVGQQVE